MLKRKSFDDSGSESSDIDNKQKRRVMVVGGRGLGVRERHLLMDFTKLIKKAKKENKVDSKKDLKLMKELSILNSCSNILLIESRNKITYLWISKTSGPTLRFEMRSFFNMSESTNPGNFFSHTNFILASNIVENKSTIEKAFSEIFCYQVNNDDFKCDKVITLCEINNNIWCRFFEIKSDQAFNSGINLTFKLDLILENCFSGKVLFNGSNIRIKQ